MTTWAFEETEGMKASRLGCNIQKLAKGCHNYANFLLKLNENNLANEYFEKGCKYSDESPCQKERWDTMAQKATPSITAVVITQAELTHEQKLKAAIKACSIFEQSYPHPVVEGFTVEEKVTGLQEEMCEYEQIMPNKSTLKCKLDIHQRENFESVDKMITDLSICQQVLLSNP